MNIIRLLCWTVPIFVWNGLRLFLFVVSLAPGFFCFAWYYFISADRVSVKYGHDSIRQTLDVYRPKSFRESQQRIPQCCMNDNNHHDDSTNSDTNADRQCLLDTNEDADIPADTDSNANIHAVPAPVLIFYTGGGWMIGYKMWGSLLARALTAAGVMVVIPDMRNYPWATVPEMVQDVNKSLLFTIENIADYGGDPNKIVVVGQSAGGHVSCMAVLERLRAQLRRDERQQQSPSTSSEWTPSQLKGFISISSPFNLKAMSASFEKKGLDDHLVDRIFGLEMERYDPFVALHELQQDEAATATDDGDSNPEPSTASSLQELLPPIRIYHGSADMTVPQESSETFYREMLKSIPDEERLSFVSYPGWSHTDPILEGPMDADQSLHRDLFDDVRIWTDSLYLSWPADDPIIKDRLCPRFMIQAARFFNPF